MGTRLSSPLLGDRLSLPVERAPCHRHVPVSGGRGAEQPQATGPGGHLGGRTPHTHTLKPQYKKHKTFCIHEGRLTMHEQVTQNDPNT